MSKHDTWSKTLVRRLKQIGFTHEQTTLIIGLITTAKNDGYAQGYKAGIDSTIKDNLEPVVDVGNLIMNMSAGLLPEHLQEDEIQALIGAYGENWFESLGYTEPEYKNPN